MIQSVLSTDGMLSCMLSDTIHNAVSVSLWTEGELIRWNELQPQINHYLFQDKQEAELAHLVPLLLARSSIARSGAHTFGIRQSLCILFALIIL